MQAISDLPPFVIDQILGFRDTSFVVIKLWLCGDKRFNAKLSEGLTYFHLQSHPYAKPKFPRIVSNLRSLRHFSIFAYGSLAPQHKWPGIVRSWPSSLESLAIHLMTSTTASGTTSRRFTREASPPRSSLRRSSLVSTLSGWLHRNIWITAAFTQASSLLFHPP